MHRPIYLAPRRPSDWFGSKNCNTHHDFLPSFSMTYIVDAPFSCFCSVSSYPRTQCPAMPPQLCATLINTHQATLPDIGRGPSGYPSNPYLRRSLLKYGSTSSMQSSVEASNMHCSPQPQSPPPDTYVAKTSAIPSPSESQMQRTKGR